MDYKEVKSEDEACVGCERDGEPRVCVCVSRYLVSIASLPSLLFLHPPSSILTPVLDVLDDEGVRVGRGVQLPAELHDRADDDREREHRAHERVLHRQHRSRRLVQVRLHRGCVQVSLHSPFTLVDVC